MERKSTTEKTGIWDEKSKTWIRPGGTVKQGRRPMFKRLQDEQCGSHGGKAKRGWADSELIRKTFAAETANRKLQEITAQRDELFMACSAVIGDLEQCRNISGDSDSIDLCRAAIAKCDLSPKKGKGL